MNRKLAPGTPVRFTSPTGQRDVIGEVILWAGFRSVKEIIPAHEKVFPSGTRWSIPEETRYIRISQLSKIEEISEIDYFLHRLRNG